MIKKYAVLTTVTIAVIVNAAVAWYFPAHVTVAAAGTINIPNFLGMTPLEVVVYLTSAAVISAVTIYLASHLTPFIGETGAVIVSKVLISAIAAGLIAGAAFFSPSWANTTLWQIILGLFGVGAGTFGTKGLHLLFGQGNQLRAAGLG